MGIDDEDDSTFTVTVDNKTFHFQVQLDIYQETGAGAGWSRGPFFCQSQSFDLAPTSVVDPSALNSDPDPELWPN